MELMTRKQAAEYLKMSIRTLDYRVADNEIAYYRMGRQKMFRMEDLDAYISRNRVCSRYDSIQRRGGRRFA